MNITTLIVAGLAIAPAAFAHNHLTIDTDGFPGGQTHIVAGYYPDEADFTIEDGLLLHAGRMAIYATPETLPGGAFAGWFAGDDLVLTSDYFFFGGNLAGGDFQFELAAVTPVSGGPADLAWGKVDAGEFVALALSSAADRPARSFAVGAGGHLHGQVMSISAPGVYDVTLIAWDANGVYVDSEPVTFRIDTGVSPADLDGNGVVDGADLGLLLGAWGVCAGDGCPGDLDENGVVDGADMGLLLAAWSA
ncbi:MAG: hypothetical protein U0575_13225 [Phycisphaerales bacterium]